MCNRRRKKNISEKGSVSFCWKIHLTNIRSANMSDYLRVLSSSSVHVNAAVYNTIPILTTNRYPLVNTSNDDLYTDLYRITQPPPSRPNDTLAAHVVRMHVVIRNDVLHVVYWYNYVRTTLDTYIDIWSHLLVIESIFVYLFDILFWHPYYLNSFLNFILGSNSYVPVRKVQFVLISSCFSGMSCK